MNIDKINKENQNLKNNNDDIIGLVRLEQQKTKGVKWLLSVMNI